MAVRTIPGRRESVAEIGIELSRRNPDPFHDGERPRGDERLAGFPPRLKGDFRPLDGLRFDAGWGARTDDSEPVFGRA